jgi:hypothetical protein
MDESKQTTEELQNTEEAVVNTDSDALLKELEATREKLAKSESDKDNYRAALLAKKRGETNYNDDGDIDLDAKIAAGVKAELEINQRRGLEDKQNNLIEKIVQENKKLREAVVALQNKPLKSAIAAGGSDEVDVKTEFFSAEQLELLKKKALSLGKDPAQFIETAKENIRKAKQ